MPINPPALDDRGFADLVTDMLRRVPAHTPEWTDLREGDAALSHDFALRLKLVDPWRRAYHDIGSLTLLNTVRDTARRTVGDRYFVSRGFFKFRYQCVNCRIQSHGT